MFDRIGRIDDISIHTPTQGVTWGGQYINLTQSISIHTLMQGVTIMGHSDIGVTLFQSTLPRRE